MMAEPVKVGPTKTGPAAAGAAPVAPAEMPPYRAVFRGMAATASQARSPARFNSMRAVAAALAHQARLTVLAEVELAVMAVAQ